MLTATVAAIGFGCKIEPVKTGGTVIDISGKTIGKKVVVQVLPLAARLDRTAFLLTLNLI